MAVLLSLGMTDSGDILERDLDSLRHLLITGNTGTGKSVLLKSVVKSIENKSYRLALIDTKGVDFANYTSSCLMMPVITDTDKAVHFLEHVEHCANKIIIVIDELSDLIAVSDDIQDILIKIAQNPQVYLIMATRKADVLSPEVIKIFDNRVVFNGNKIGDAHYMSGTAQEQIHIQTRK